MTSPKRFLVLLALAAAGLVAGASSASAAKTPKVTKKYTYKVELKGTQTMSWSLNHVGSGTCDANQTGSGKETIRFSAKPATFYTYDGLSQPFFFAKGKTGDPAQATLNLRGSVTRSGAVQTGKTDDCANGGGGTAIPPDCGTRAIKGLTVTPQYEYKKDRIILEQSDAAKSDFRNCPPGGSTWPYLLRDDEKGNSIGQDLPVDDLFNQGKNIIIATGTYTYDTGELKYTNKIRWELSFTRVKVEDLTKG